jgi:cyclic beta-1,2-glucan synthetase
MQPLFLLWQTWMARPGHLVCRATEPPLRAELFGVEQLARLAPALAAEHRSVIRRSPTRLLARLGHNEDILRAFNRETVSVDRTRQVTPAAEWLLDNFYLLEEQIQLARRHLPRNYSHELPRLLAGQSAGLPRIYDLVLTLISHVDAQIEAAPLTAFVAAYQTVSPLKLGELWAIPIMLRLGLIENLQRITTRLAVAREDRDLADLWAHRLQAMAESEPSHLVVVVSDMAKSDLPLSTSFVAEFCQKLSRQNPVLQLARSWVAQRLAEQGLSIEQLVHQESQDQAANQLSVSHSIASLRFIGAMDWKEFVETLGVVEHTLRTDPAGIYGAMDFATRDRYRHVIEALARRSRLSETEVAAHAIHLAEANALARGRRDRTAHVGFFLIDRGLPLLERAVKVGAPWCTLLARGIRRFPLAFYVGGISLLTVLVTLGFIRLAGTCGVTGWKLAAFTAVFLLCASQLSVALMNWLSTLLVKPSVLPRLDYSSGIASDHRTMVVVPTLLTSAAAVDRLIENLEIHALANRDEHLHFALLTDFRDAQTETDPADEALLARARAGVESLNSQYPATTGDRFFLFHRPRRWNPGEGRWMGYERKRGKLAEFNALLRGGAPGCFSTIVGDTAILRAIKYVITLDTDTQLPRDSARQLVGTMAHPLNHPQFDAARGIVIEGYGILQPRVGVSLPSAGRSWFVRLFAGDAGIDPYTRAVSDVYQDIFQEGSFIGKGIYDVDAFARALAGRCPENAVLSHDLLESCHARSALVSDVEFYEEYPSHYSVDIGRRHRWIRGDWQISPWLLPRVPGADARRIANPLSTLSQWKIFDNLRRSLVPVALTFFLLGNWLLLPELGGLGALLALAIVSLPGLLSLSVELARKPRDLPWAMHLRGVAESAGRQLAQILLTVVFLPYDAFISLDAIGRTLLRLLITRRRLLEWRTSSETDRTARTDLGGFYASMWITPLLASVTALVLFRFAPAQLSLALPVLGLWFVAPCLAWWISQPIAAPVPDLSDDQRLFLRRTARKTWHFFETFVTAQENWLPPDNFQEIPASLVAARTSPTNIGLALLANLAARDFGYLSVGGLLRRTQDTFATLQRLERYRGHFYNWYDTRTLQPLLPLYVSSVDSGNLAGHLLTLGAGLREFADEKLFDPRVFGGLRDTVGALRQLNREHAALTQLDALLASSPATCAAVQTALERALHLATQIATAFAHAPEDIQRWSQTLQRNCADHLADWRLFAPSLPPSALLAALPTLRQLAESDASSASGICARERLVTLEALAQQCDRFAAMDFSFLFDPARDLFAIGYNATERRRDLSFFDLLASEARLCSYVAIAQGQVPQDHWFSLGRLLVASHGDPMLVSWSGSMFEYLMPLLVMPTYENTLLDHTCRRGPPADRLWPKRGVPWGISESGYHRTDVHLNYQYRAFGVPGLGLKRGLADDLVIAPYASAMALDGRPARGLRKPAASRRRGPRGRLRLLRGVDYTPSRLPPDETSVTIRSFMAHHQGMSLLALLYLLHDRPCNGASWPARCCVRPTCCCRNACPRPPERAHRRSGRSRSRASSPATRATTCALTSPSPAVPEVHLLSNGRYHVAISSAGGGYSRWRDLAVTRWREDATRDCWGTFIYLRDVPADEVWSAAHQPDRRMPPNTTKPSSRRRAPSSASAMPVSKCTPRSASRRRTTWSCGASPDQPFARHAQHRADQLRRGRARHRGLRRRASRVQQPLRANRIRAAPRPSLHAPRPLAGRKAARGFCTSWPAPAANRAKSPARRIAPASSDAAASLARPAALRGPARCPTPPAPSSIPSSRCAAPSRCRPRIGRHGLRPGHAPTPAPQALALADEIPARAHGRPRLRPRLDAQPGDAAPAQRHRGRGAALRPAGQRPGLRRPRAARLPGRARRQPARPERALVLRHFRRCPARPAAHQRPASKSASSGN